MPNHTRSIPVLLQVIYVDETDPLHAYDQRIVAAFDEQRISDAEARLLQRFAGLSPRARKRELEATIDVTPEAIENMRAKLNGVMDRFYGQRPELKDRRDV